MPLRLVASVSAAKTDSWTLHKNHPGEDGNQKSSSALRTRGIGVLSAPVNFNLNNAAWCGNEASFGSHADLGLNSCPLNEL